MNLISLFVLCSHDGEIRCNIVLFNIRRRCRVFGAGTASSPGKYRTFLYTTILTILLFSSRDWSSGSGWSFLYASYDEVELGNRDRPVKVFDWANKKDGDYVGCVLISQLSTFPNMCITAADYDEYGSTIIHRVRISFRNHFAPTI